MTEELNSKKVNPITVGLIIVIGAIGVEIGLLIKGQEFNYEEVQGLRSDMDKEDNKHLQRIEDLESLIFEHLTDDH